MVLPLSGVGLLYQTYLDGPLYWPLPPAGIAAVSLAAIALIALVVGRGDFRRPLPAGLAALALLNVALAQSLAGLVMAGLWALGYLALAIDEPGRKVLLPTFIALLVLQCAVGLGAYAVGWEQYTTSGFGPRASSVYGSPNLLYPLVLLGLIAFLALGMRLTGRGRLWAFGVAALCGLCLVLTFSRAGWLGAAAGLVILAPSAPPRLRWVLIVLAIGWVVGAAVARTGGEITSPTNDKPTAARLTAWQLGWDAFLRSPVVGGGFDAYGRHLQDIGNPRRTCGPPPDPKNVVLSLAIDNGLVGLGLLGGSLAAALGIARRRRDDPALFFGDRYAAFLLPAVLASLFAAGLVDTTFLGGLDRSAATVAFLILLGLAAPTEAP
ncbi:MAG: O-antigen ligase family protein [Fimbriimonadaceae bacterium]